MARRATLGCICLQIEAVWLQDFAGRIPGYPDIGPCIVIKGKQPCCGLLPAVHMTDNNHMAIPLRAMSKVIAGYSWALVSELQGYCCTTVARSLLLLKP